MIISDPAWNRMRQLSGLSIYLCFPTGLEGMYMLIDLPIIPAFDDVVSFPCRS